MRQADKRIARSRRFSHRVIARQTGMAVPGDTADSILSIYQHLATDESRNNLIASDVVNALEAGRCPLVLTERRIHLSLLESKLCQHTANVVALHGGLSKRERAAAMSRLRAFGHDEERIILATGRFAGEGFDDPQLDTLFLALPVAWRGTLVQYAGRLHREHNAKHDVQIFDYVDAKIPVLDRMFDKRRRGYQSMGYTIENDGLIDRRPSQLALHYRARKPGVPPKTSPTKAVVAERVDQLPSSELDALIDDVLVGAFTPNDQAIAFLEVLDDQLELPINATAGKTTVVVEALAINDRNQLIARCTTTTGRARRIPLTKLVPESAPIGWEWAEAHNRWVDSGDGKTPREQIQAITNG